MNVDASQPSFMPSSETTDTLLVVRSTHRAHRDQEKQLYICFVGIEKAFDRVPRKVME